MRKNRVVEQDRCYHLVSRLAHRAFFLDDEEKDRAVALMRRVEAGVQASMCYCISFRGSHWWGQTGGVNVFLLYY